MVAQAIRGGIRKIGQLCISDCGAFQHRDGQPERHVGQASANLGPCDKSSQRTVRDEPVGKYKELDFSRCASAETSAAPATPRSHVSRGHGKRLAMRHRTDCPISTQRSDVRLPRLSTCRARMATFRAILSLPCLGPRRRRGLSQRHQARLK
jgi:hypothetical protein